MILKSKRLSFRPFQQSDFKDLHRIGSDARVMKYIGKPETPEESQTSLDCCLRFNAAHPEMGYWACHTLDGGTFAGSIVLRFLDDSTTDYELGYRLHPDFWGQGMASEMAGRVLYHAFHTLQLPKVIAMAETENFASIAVLKKWGMTFTHMGWCSKTNVELVNYAVERPVFFAVWKKRSL